MSKPLVVRWRFLSFSVLMPTLVSVIVLALFTGAVLLFSLSAGVHWLSPVAVFNALLGELDPSVNMVVESFRLPRTLMAAMVGAGLASSGLVLQSVIRNPLASPDVMGMTSGASAAAVGFISFYQFKYGVEWLPVFAICGAMMSSGLVYLLGWRNGVTPMRLILVGIGVSAATGALTTLIIAVSPASTSISAYIWLTGSVYGANWNDVNSLLPWTLVGLPVVLLFSRCIDAQELGDQLATGLGISVEKTRLVLLFLSVILAAPAVAYAGAVGFVGLIAPHIARRLVERKFALLLPVTALIGACLVMLADLLGRLIFLPLDIPAGVFVSAIGAPFFIYLLFKQRF